MRAPRDPSVPRPIRRPGLWAGLLFALAALASPAHSDEYDWRLARRGRELFVRDWRVEDSRCHGGDGLGPLYNATSCVACHGLGGAGGAGPASTNVDLLNLAKFQTVTIALAQDVGAQRSQGRQGPRREPPSLTLNRDSVIERVHPGLRESASIVLHHFGVGLDYKGRHDALLMLKGPSSRVQGPPESVVGTPEIEEKALLSHLQSSRLATVTQRNPTPLFGVGLIDAIPDQAIYAAAGEAVSASNGLHGRVHRLKGGRVGKFGWKAQVGSLQEFVLTACSNELGLENPGHHQAASPSNPDAVARTPDLTGAECDALVAYVRDLPRPAVLDLGSTASASATAGRALFDTIGCANCHRPSLGGVGGIYSDLLIHDMGPGLSDSGQYYGTDDSDSSGAPKSSEWRTPPLWGMRESAPYLHDGRAATAADAITHHGGEAQEPARRFAALSIEQKFQLETFLKSLTAPARPNELASRSLAARDEWARDVDAAEAQARAAERERIEQKARESELAERRRIEKEERRPEVRLQIARLTEFNGHTNAALDLYRELVRNHPNSRAAGEARERINVLTK
jgi:CxxC motif-containing protein (DUF1111 family)